jgi:copper chaperone CopZ
VRVSLKAVAGVDSVDVSLEKGLARVQLKPGNTVTLKQLQDAITKNGFVMKSSYATLAGTVSAGAGRAQLKVSGSNDVLQLVPESPDALHQAQFQQTAHSWMEIQFDQFSRFLRG